MKQDKTKVDNFEQINIDNRDKIWTNNELNNILHSYTKPRTNDAGLELEPLTRLVNFSEYTSYITDEKLLNEAINYIKKESYLIDTDKNFEALKNRFNKVYSDSDWKIIKAIFYSLEARFQIFISNVNPRNYNQPFSYFEIKDRVIYHNLNFVKEITLRNSDIDFKENIKALPIETGKEIYNKRIESLIDLDYKQGTNISSKTIKYLKKSKKSLDTIIKPTIQVSQKISEVEKDEVFNELVFNKGLYYFSDIQKSKIQNAYKNLENDFGTKEDFVKAVNSLLHANGLHFYSKLRTLTNETEFIKYIQSQYDLYNEYTPNNSLNWLNFTKKAIMYGFGILRIENDYLKALFLNWYNEIIKKIETSQPERDNEIDIYLKSYNENHFDEVIIKRNEDGTPNNIYLGNNFNEWLSNVDKNLLANKSYDAEIQDKLSTYNKYLLFLVQDLIGLYKAVSGYKKTNNASFITSMRIQENKISQRLDSIKYYSEIVKHYKRNKQFQKANDIKDYCIALFDNCVYNLNDVLTIDIYKSPLKIHFENVKIDLENSIDFKELTLISQLQTKTVKQETNILLKLNLQINYFYKRLCLGNMLKLKENFLVCSDEPLFDIEKLKQYFIDNSLNDFAKSELEKLIELINDFEIKRNEYFLIPNPNPLIFYQYEYVNSKGGKSWGSVSAKLEYFHYTDNKISHLLETGFKDRIKNSEYFVSITVDKIYVKCIEIREVCEIMMQPKQLKGINSDEVEILHPKYDPNLWNKDCFELFKYLYDCYYKNTKRQITNIWFYLKENGNLKYVLKATKEQYEVFILEYYRIKITNFDKAQAKWEDKEFSTINDHRINFEDGLK